MERLHRAGQEVLCAARGLQRYEDVLAEVTRQGLPDRIICAAGRTHTEACSTVDGLEAPEAQADLWLANFELPLWVAHAAREASTPALPVLYIGTGCLYRGADDSPPFTEEDEPNFQGSAYSRVKGLADAHLRSSEAHVCVARIRMPIDSADGPRDLVSKLLSYETICDDGANSMTVLDDALPALLVVAHHAGPAFGGAFHVVNEGWLRHPEVLRLFCEASGREPHRYRLTRSAEDLALVAPRSACKLSPSKFQRLLADAPEALRELYGSPARLPSLEEGLWRAARARRAASPRKKKKEGPRYLVTGGCGFIGAALVNHLLRADSSARVVNVDCLAADCGASAEAVFAATAAAPEALKGRYRHVRLDLADSDAECRLLEILEEEATTHVAHLAAKTHVDDSFDVRQTLEYTRTNVLGTHRLLEAARRYAESRPGALRLFLHMSTDEVYGETKEAGDEEPHREDTSILNPTNPYAATKAGAEQLARAYGASYRLPLAIVRCANVFGPGQHGTKVVPRFFAQALAGRALTLHGDGAAKRCFLYVTDVVRALELLLRQEPRGVYNIGSGEETTVLELAQKILRLAASGGGSIVRVADRPFNDRRYWLDDTRLRDLGWRPLVPLSTGLHEILYRTLQQGQERRPAPPGSEAGVEGGSLESSYQVSLEMQLQEALAA